MRFTGQVRVPEVDHPGIPATIVVEDGLAEVLLDGESLGRWSLYDVHAARLVSSAFSISLDGEEITFIADEPVDFAYKGVEHMAGVWARYKSMTMPRRLVAVGRSRRGATPSRIPELREAMLLNLETAGRSPSRSAPAPAAPAEAPERSPWAQRLDAYSNVPSPIDDGPEPVEVRSDPVEPETAEPEAVDLESAAIDASRDEEPAPPSAERVSAQPGSMESAQAPPPLRPGPGLIPRQVVRPRTEPSRPSTETPEWDSVWEEPPPHEEVYEEPPSDAALIFADEAPAGDVLAARVGREPEAEIGRLADGGRPEDDSTGPDPTPAPPEAIVEELPAVATDEKTEPREVVLDLGNLEAAPALARRAGSHPVVEDMVEPDLELLFAGAPGPESERGGLFGAVRSAFTRNRGGSHEHQFVEAPGGIGIVRQICAECGYISIGVSD